MSDYIYCGFWRRCGAYLLDLLTLLFIASCIAFIPYFLPKIPYLNKNFDKWFSIEENFDIFIRINIVFLITEIVFYWALFESSKLQATPGKYLLKMKIINKDGTKISFLRSFSRSILYTIIFGLGIGGIINLLCIAFTKQKHPYLI